MIGDLILTITKKGHLEFIFLSLSLTALVLETKGSKIIVMGVAQSLIILKIISSHNGRKLFSV